MSSLNRFVRADQILRVPYKKAFMRTDRLPQFDAVRRVPALGMAVGMVAAVARACCGVAAVASHRQLRTLGRAVADSGMTLAQAPTGLLAVVRQTLGVPVALAGGVVHAG
jgi:hypothetical protein